MKTSLRFTEEELQAQPGERRPRSQPGRRREGAVRASDQRAFPEGFAVTEDSPLKHAAPPPS